MNPLGFGPSPRAALACVLLLVASLASARAAERITAYSVPAGTLGTQAFEGVIGMDFEVVNPIVVVRLGVFDDTSDGLKRPLVARIFDRTNPDAPTQVASLEFTPEDAGELIGGSRFKTLAVPLRLEVGFKGTITAENYGAEERLKNSGGNLANRNWTVNDGNGSLLFVGTSRYGVTQGEFPGEADGGPADRYAAGTFEFETTPALRPGVPSQGAIRPADGQITLSWQAVTNPLPAAKYEILRADSRTGAFTKIGEATNPQVTSYTDAGLNNGQGYCYQIRAVAANGQTSDPSPALCGAPFRLAEGQIIAYRVNAGLIGTQAFGGTLGMDFEIDNAILVTHLGVFDDGSDGLALALTARLWDRANPDAPVELGSLEFTAESPGELVNGSRFKALPAPIRLEPGFRGTITAENYGAGERLYNPGGDPKTARPWSLGSGSGSIRFTGSGRYSVNPGEFPATPDGGAPDRYATGTFQFKTTELINPGAPIVTASLGDKSAILAWPAVVEPAPAAKYVVWRAQGESPAQSIAEVTTPGYVDTAVTPGTTYCYSVTSVTAANKSSAASPSLCLTIEAREPGVAYKVAASTVGNQDFGGALGMDFDVASPIKVTKLGVFDDSSDGLFLPINARLYNRATQEVVATLDFTADSAGELVEGSRFKSLPSPLSLPAGFQGTMVASGYGGDERNGNGLEGRSVYSAGGAILFVGTARYGVNPSGFPDTADGGPANRYAAGTFFFEPAAAAPSLAIARAGTRITLTWAGTASLESSPSPAGPWTPLAGVASGGSVEASGTATFYRLRQ